MASSYALPLNSSSETHHGHSRSQYLPERNPSWISQINGASPGKKSQATSGDGTDRQEDCSTHTGKPHTLGLPPFPHTTRHSNNPTTTRLDIFDNSSSMRGRPRGESDLGRPPTYKTSNGGPKFGFSPIEEAPSKEFPAPSRALPETLTALLVPLPFLFASLAYPKAIAHIPKLPSGVASSDDDLYKIVSHNSQFLHACTLSSATLLLTGILSRIFVFPHTLDRRKSVGNSRSPKTGSIWGVDSLLRMSASIAAVLLPFYAAMQLGGARVALGLLTAITAGIGSLSYKPGKHSLPDTWKRTIRTRRLTCAVFLLGFVCDMLSSGAHKSSLFMGHLALATSILIVPLPLPTTNSALVTGTQENGNGGQWKAQERSHLSAVSSLTSSPENQTLSLIAGVVLSVFTIIFSAISSWSPSISRHAVFFFIIAVSLATALFLFSVPASLRTDSKRGFALGCITVFIFGFVEGPVAWHGLPYIPLLCILSFAAVQLDVPSASSVRHSHSHGHDHGHGHDHAHSHSHDHHLHQDRSKLSNFLIRHCRPGSIPHSILLEKDSRRIAYFGILNLSFMMVQFFYGFVSGSLGLLTDSIHMLFDCAGLAVGLAAAVMSKWPPNMRFPYGYGKIDTLSGFANGIFLMLVSVEIVFDAFERLWEGHELHRLNELLVVSVLGFLVNIVGLTAFGHAHHGHGHDHGDHSHDGHSHGHSHSHDNENMQGIFLHILADALGSVAVILSTLLTKYYGWSGWDPIASCIIAVLIFFSAIPLVKSSGMRLMLSLPADVEYATRNALQELSSLRGIVCYTVPRFWLEDAGAAHAGVHAHEKHERHDGHSHSQSHSHSDHCDHDHDHDHDHGHSESHTHDHHDHHHSEHSHEGPKPGQQKVLGVIHVIAARAADLEDVRDRTEQFLKSRNMDVVVHVEREGDGRCWCGGGVKTG